MDLSRRTVLKVLGMTAAGAALPGCEQEVHRLVPYVLPDEEIVPGVANWYASVCGECDAGCGILVRVMEGRAKKIEGNPDHPLNRGKHCAKADAALQALYHPDRLTGPMRRTGNRGDGSFQPVGWDEAMALWVEQLQRHPGAASILSGPLHGTLASLFADFARSLDASFVQYQPGDQPVLRSAFQRSAAREMVPHFDLTTCDYLLSFGAPFLHDWLSPVHYGIGYGEMRRGRPAVRGRFVQIEPRLSATGACADQWVPVRPGTEGLLALGIGQALLTRIRARGPGAKRADAHSLFSSVSLAEIAARTDVSEHRILVLAEDLARASNPLVIAGGAAASHTNGTLALRIAFALNGLLDNKGVPLRFYRPADFPSSSPAAAGAQAVSRLMDDFMHGTRRLLHLYGADPLYTLPPSTGIQRLFERADFTVSFSPFLDDSSAMADLILPGHTGLESWGDYPLPGVIPQRAVGLRQPSVRPVHDTRFVGDVILQAAQQVNESTSAALPWPDFKTLLQERWQAFIRTGASYGEGTGTFDETWIALLRQGGWWTQASEPLAPRQDRLPPVYQAGTFSGDAGTFPFYFHPYPAPSLGYGEGASKPWLQELPDPLTTIVWNSWLEINPGTAKELGVRHGELVRVVSAFGELNVAAVHFPGIRPDVVAMPIGWGHRFFGRYAASRGSNPLSILSPSFDSESGALATGATRVRIEPTGRREELIFIGSQIDSNHAKSPI